MIDIYHFFRILKSTEITEKGTQLITDSLTKLPHLNKLALFLKGLNLSDKGTEIISNSLKQMKSLKELTLDLA